MSEFREVLKQYFIKNGINITQLSQRCGIDRTTIQHMIGRRRDYRLPGTDIFECVLSELRLTPGERKHIEELYTIEKIGIHNYMGRKYVKNIIEQIAVIHKYGAGDRRHIEGEHMSAGSTTTLYKGRNAVNSIAYSICVEETMHKAKPQIRLNVPFSYAYLKQTLLQLYWEMPGSLEIHHIIKLHPSPKTKSNPNMNLEVISDILPFAFCLGQGYDVNYYYSSVNPEDELLLSMPYYLLTGDNLLLISGDFDSAILIKDKQMISEYGAIFEKNYNQCRSLIQHDRNPLGIFKAYSDCMHDGCPAYSIQMHPCFFQHMTEEIIIGAARRDAPYAELIVNSFVEYTRKFKRMDVADYFSVNGLAKFVETGEHTSFSLNHAIPYSIQARIELLQSTYDSIQNGDKTRFVDSSKISLSDTVIVSTINNNSLQFYFCDHDNYHYCVITEASIVNSFVDFFNSLAQSDLVYSKEETLSIIQHSIDELNGKFTK